MAFVSVLSGLGESLATAGRTAIRNQFVPPKANANTPEALVATTQQIFDAQKSFFRYQTSFNIGLLKSTNELTKKINFIADRISPKDITAGKGQNKQTYRYDPLAPQGQQVTTLTASGKSGRFASKSESAAVLSKAAYLGAPQNMGTSAPTPLAKPVESDEERFKRLEKISYEESETPLAMFKEETNKNFQKVFEMLDAITEQISSVEGGGGIGGAILRGGGAAGGRGGKGGAAARKGGRLAGLGRALGTVGRVAGKVAIPLGVGIAAYDAYKGFTANEDATLGEKLKNAGSSALSGVTFGLLGSSAEEISARAAETTPTPPTTSPALEIPPTGMGTPEYRPGTGAAGTGTRAPTISGDDDIKNMIKQHEGLRLFPYKDSLGLWTVGYGHLIGDGKTLPPEMNREFSMDEVNQMFEQDYAHHRKAAEKIPGFDKLGKAGQGALTDLTFNMGPSWYKGFPKFTAALERGDIENAARELENSRWYDQVKSRAPKIVGLLRSEMSAPGAPAPMPAVPDTDQRGQMLASGGTAAAPAATMAAAPPPAPTPVTPAPTAVSTGSQMAAGTVAASSAQAQMAATPTIINNVIPAPAQQAAAPMQPPPTRPLPEVDIEKVDYSIKASFNRDRWALG